MPPLRGLNWVGPSFYKDAAPPALRIHSVRVTIKTVIQKIFDEPPAP